MNSVIGDSLKRTRGDAELDLYIAEHEAKAKHLMLSVKKEVLNLKEQEEQLEFL